MYYDAVGSPAMSAVMAVLASLASMIRWAEPWDIELDDDPLLERTRSDDRWG
jgi:hypothetical protein